MKPKDPTQFSWRSLFIVTAICFLFFAGLIKFMNGSSWHTTIFFIIGIIALALYFITFFDGPGKKRESKKK